MNELVQRAKKTRKAQGLRELVDRAIEKLRDALPGMPQPRLQPIPVRVKRRKG